MQFIAKSGGNQYRGTVYADYENRAWQSFNIDEDQIARGVEQGGGLSAARNQPPLELSRRQRGRGRLRHEGRLVVVLLSSAIRTWLRDTSTFRDRPHRTRVTNYTGKATYQATPQPQARGVRPGRTQSCAQSPGSLGTDRPHRGERDSMNRRNRQRTSGAGAGCAKVTGTPSSTTDCSSRSAPGSLAPTCNRGRTARTPRDSKIPTRWDVRGGNRDFFSSMRRDQLFGSGQSFQRRLVGKPSFQRRRRGLPDIAGRHLEERLSGRRAARRARTGSLDRFTSWRRALDRRPVSGRTALTPAIRGG